MGRRLCIPGFFYGCADCVLDNTGRSSYGMLYETSSPELSILCPAWISVIACMNLVAQPISDL